MNPKYQKVLSDIEKAEKKKSEIEGQLKELYDKKTEGVLHESQVPESPLRH